jgi:hypothetical protein
MMKTYDPDQDHLVDDNVEAMRLIVDRGVLHLLKPKPDQQFVAHFYETEHHYCMASYHCGHELEKDNGYGVYLASKKKHTADQAADHFAYAISQTTEGITYGWMETGNKKNN